MQVSDYCTSFICPTLLWHLGQPPWGTPGLTYSVMTCFQGSFRLLHTTLSSVPVAPLHTTLRWRKTWVEMTPCALWQEAWQAAQATAAPAVGRGLAVEGLNQPYSVLPQGSLGTLYLLVVCWNNIGFRCTALLYYLCFQIRESTFWKHPFVLLVLCLSYFGTIVGSDVCFSARISNLRASLGLLDPLKLCDRCWWSVASYVVFPPFKNKIVTLLFCRWNLCLQDSFWSNRKIIHRCELEWCFGALCNNYPCIIQGLISGRELRAGQSLML